MTISRGGTPVQGFWTGPPLTPLHWACLRSFVNCGHQFVLYSYETLAAPEGVCVKDARQIISEEEIFYFDNPETRTRDIAPFADYFRLRLLHDVGGWYCDVDTVCLSSRLPAGPRVWARQCPELNLDSVSNGQLFFEKGDPLVVALLEECEKRLSHIERRESLGPLLISSVLKAWNLPRDMGATAATFYPIRWIEVFMLWLPEFRVAVEERLKGAAFLPLYQSFPVYIGLDPQKRPPAGSYLSSLLNSFEPEAADQGQDADDVRALTRRWFHSQGSWAVEWLTAIHGPGIVARLGLQSSS